MEFIVKLLILVLMSLISMSCYAMNNGSSNNVGVVIIDGNVVSGSANNDFIQGNGNRISQVKKLNTFYAISNQIIANIRIVSARHYSIMITADENIMPFIATNIINNELVIASDKNFSSREVIDIKIEVPFINKVRQLGIGFIQIDDMQTNKLSLIIEGQGNINAKGRVEELKADIFGTGNMNLKHLLSKNAYLNITGSGNIEVSAYNELNASIDGIGNIRYSGKPNIIRQSITGIGQVESSF